MQVMIHYKGYNPHELKPYLYDMLAANGESDQLYHNKLTYDDKVEMPDKLWQEGSGHVTVECDECHTVFKQRAYPGQVVACPVCAFPLLIPEDYVLDEMAHYDIC